jgi:hypothetical protein
LLDGSGFLLGAGCPYAIGHITDGASGFTSARCHINGTRSGERQLLGFYPARQAQRLPIIEPIFHARQIAEWLTRFSGGEGLERRSSAVTHTFHAAVA